MAKRFDVKFGKTELSQFGLILDISWEGAFISASRLPDIGSRLHIQVHSGERIAYYEGVVRHHRIAAPARKHVDPTGFGVSFLTPREIFEELFTERAVGELPRFDVHFDTLQRLKTSWEKELRFGGLLLRVDREIARDSQVLVALRLDFAGKELTFKARVVQLGTAVSASGLAVGFEDPAAVKAALKPFVSTLISL